MTDRRDLIHDLNVISHLSERVDLREKEQIRTILLMQKDDGLFKTDYGKRFIARLIAYFTGKPTPDTCIFSGRKIYSLFPVSEDFLAQIDSSVEEAADFIIELETTKKQEEDAPNGAAKGADKKACEFSDADKGKENNVLNLFKDIKKPWRYTKVYVGLFVIFLLTGYWFIMTRGAGAVPFEMSIGAGLAPAAVILFFNELLEVYERPLSFKTTILLSGLGALMSLFFTWVTGDIFNSVPAIHVFLKALIDGAVCMLTILAIVMQYIKKCGNNVTMLQGIYFGSCFGVGFSFYEVCDAALSQYFTDLRPGVFMWHLITQSVMAVGGRIVWCAVIGGAFSVIIHKADVIKSQEFLKMCLLAFIFPFALQICWDAGFMNAGLYGVSLKNIFLMIVDFMVLNLFLHRGIREARKEKSDV